MNNQHIFVPKNPILRHCSDSFYKAFSSRLESFTVVYCLAVVDFKAIRQLVQQIIKLKQEDTFTVFFLAVQSDYLALLCLLKLTAAVLTKNVKACYLMHEPWLEKGRVNPMKSLIIFSHQFLFGHLADVIILPSNEAVAKAETFVRKDKIRKVNLSFLSIPLVTLEKNLQLLKCSWDTRKVFSMLGTVSSWDKNPQGFLDFASVFNELHPGQAQFIRGGRDRGIQVQYDEGLVIRFPSYLTDSTKGFLLNLSHFVIIPYSFSTQSGVLTEALSYGKILIVNDIPAFRQFKELDFIVPVNLNDRGSILNCIENILNMEFHEYENRYWSAIQYFQQNHSEEYLLSKLSDFL